MSHALSTCRTSVLYAVNDFFLFRNDCISSINQLLCALRFYATGCFQITAADLSGMSTSTAHRIVHRVSSAIASLRPLYIIFPETPDDTRRSQLDFYNKARFPKVIGAIDCIHVKLGKSPGRCINFICKIFSMKVLRIIKNK